MSITFN